MKYDKYIKLKEEFSDSPDWGIQLAFEMCCGFTGDSRYCGHLIKSSQYGYHECKLGLNPEDMKDWICSEHTIRKQRELKELKIKEEREKYRAKYKKPKEVKPNISKWFDINMEGD